MNPVNNAWANNLSRNNLMNLNANFGANNFANRKQNANFVRVGVNNFSAQRFGSSGSNNFGCNNSRWTTGNDDVSNNLLLNSCNNLNNLNNSLSISLSNLSRNLHNLNNISNDLSRNLKALNNQCNGSTNNNNNAWFRETQWSATMDADNRNLHRTANMANDNCNTAENQTSVGVFADATGTRIIIGNGTAGSLWEHINWPSSAYQLDTNAAR
uniref:Pentapeptide repeats family protein n=1 Tax=Ascaris lumbricoides TaxID=6252 RepID=A0A0M3I5N7_ASCLU